MEVEMISKSHEGDHEKRKKKINKNQYLWELSVFFWFSVSFARKPHKKIWAVEKLTEVSDINYSVSIRASLQP